MNALLRKVKLRKTVTKLLSEDKPITVFRKLSFTKHKNKAKQLTGAYYEVFSGHFYNYQLPLTENEQAVFIGTNKITVK